MALGITPIEIVNKGTHPLLVKDSEWERVELSNIADVQNGYAFSSGLFNHKEGLPLIRIRDIFSTKTENYYSGDYSEDFVVSHNDILIGMDGDFKISRWPGQKGLLNQRVCRIRFFSSYYLESFLFICVQPYLDAIHSETSAVTVKHLSSRTINDIPLPLPPLPIQRAIVSKIEALFSDLDNGIANLKKAQEQLKIYRQAVLKKAFQGGLSNILRTDELPLGWIEGELGNIISISSGKGLTKENREDDGVYFVYGGNGITGKHSEFLYENEKLIIGRVGVHCGNVHITKPKSWITDNAFVVSFDEDVFDLHFLHYFLTILRLISRGFSAVTQ